VETELTTNNFELLNWQDATQQVKTLFPDIYESLAKLAVAVKHPFIKLSYRYGDPVIENGKFMLTYQGKTVACDDPSLPEEYLKLLTYSSDDYIPMIGVLKGTLECFVNLPSHLIPLRLLKPGTLFGIYNLFYPERKSHVLSAAYSYSAGSRSLLILPKISHEQYNERLSKHFTINKDYLCPKHFPEQWALFRELAQAPEFKEPWHTELLLFTQPLFELIEKDKELQLLLAKNLMKVTQFARSQMMYDLIWSIFTDKLSAGIKNTPFVVETVKHIIKLAMGEVPGYVPAQNNDQGPLAGLRDIFLNVYRIRYYLPVFMELNYYNRTDPVYYSLQRHTFLYHIPERSNANRTVDELMEIRNLIYSFKQQVLENKFPISLENTILYQTLQEVEFEFFHPQGNGKEIITEVTLAIDEDSRFLKLFDNLNIDKELIFPKHSLFFNGCIRIRPQKRQVNKPTIKDFVTAANFRLDDKE
jgi:hypothetical protein